MDKESIPYMVVHHPASGNTAIYGRRYELMLEKASQALLQFAKNQPFKFKQGFDLSDAKQQPKWINEDIKQECVLYFCYDDGSTDSHLRKIPLY
jgi:hypothetical protein